MHSDTEFITLSRMLYPEIFRLLERIRWNMTDDVPWDAFDGTLLSVGTFISVKDLNCFQRETTAG